MQYITVTSKAWNLDITSIYKRNNTRIGTQRKPDVTEGGKSSDKTVSKILQGLPKMNRHQTGKYHALSSPALPSTPKHCAESMAFLLQSLKKCPLILSTHLLNSIDNSETCPFPDLQYVTTAVTPAVYQGTYSCQITKKQKIICAQLQLGLMAFSNKHKYIKS